MGHRQRCNYDVAVASRISLRGGEAGKGKGRHARKVVVALGDNLIQSASLERSGVCTSGGEKSDRDNSGDGLERWHVASLIYFCNERGVINDAIGKECGYCERVSRKCWCRCKGERERKDREREREREQEPNILCGARSRLSRDETRDAFGDFNWHLACAWAWALPRTNASWETTARTAGRTAGRSV